MIVTTVVYIKQKDKTLLLHRTKKQDDINAGYWIGLGGKVEKGESPEECVIRETQEESGLTIMDPKLCGFITFIDQNLTNDIGMFVYTANQFTGEIIECEEGELAWIDDDKIIDLPLWEGDKLFFPWLDQNKFFSAKFVYKQNKLSHHQVVFY